MASNFPTSLDSFSNPISSNTLDFPSHSGQHSDVNDAVEALEAKVGIGNSPAGSASSGQVLLAQGGGTATWADITSLTNTSLVNSLLIAPQEFINIVASSTTGTVDVDAKTSGVTFYTSDSSANWTLNFRGDVSTTLNDLIEANQSVSHVFLNTNGATPYYASAFQIDGTAITPEWLGGSALNAGSANSIDAYAFTIIKTSGTPTYTVLASQSQFA
jgi:hypothetical protein